MNDNEKVMEDEDVLLLILISLVGYEIEENKPLSVDKNVLAPIFEDAQNTGKRPVIALTHTDDDRLQLRVTMENLDD